MPIGAGVLSENAARHRTVPCPCSGIDGTGCGVGNSDAFYHWGALLSYIALDADEQAPA